jgi:hypothetical protein
MDCQEREELEAIITAVLDRRDELNKISSDDPNFGQYKQEIEKLSSGKAGARRVADA